MSRKREDRKKRILYSGGFGLMAQAPVQNKLFSLQMLLRLKELGLSVSGNNVSICRIVCSRAVYEKIVRRTEETKSILVLFVKEMETECDGIFGKKKRIRKTELVCAAGSEDLFFLIDLKPEKFEMLPFSETALLTGKTLEQ